MQEKAGSQFGKFCDLLSFLARGKLDLGDAGPGRGCHRRDANADRQKLALNRLYHLTFGRFGLSGTLEIEAERWQNQR